MGAPQAMDGLQMSHLMHESIPTSGAVQFHSLFFQDNFFQTADPVGPNLGRRVLKMGENG